MSRDFQGHGHPVGRNVHPRGRPHRYSSWSALVAIFAAERSTTLGPPDVRSNQRDQFPELNHSRNEFCWYLCWYFAAFHQINSNEINVLNVHFDSAPGHQLLQGLSRAD